MGKGDSNNLPLSFRQFLYGKPIDFRLGQLNAEAFNRLDCPLPVFPFKQDLPQHRHCFNNSGRGILRALQTGSRAMQVPKEAHVAKVMNTS